jgi:predicted RNA-binding protein with TRAM domain
MLEVRTAQRPQRRRHVVSGVSLLAILAAILLSGVGSQGVYAQTSATITVQPSKAQVAPGETFTVTISQDADVPTLGATGTFYFNPAVVQIVSIEAGPDYADAQLLYGIAPLSGDEAIAAANSNGHLEDLTTFYLEGTGTVSPGSHVIATITMKGKAGGKSDLKLDQRQQNVTDLYGNVKTVPVPVGILPDPPDAQGNYLPTTVTQSSVTVVAGATPPPTAAASASTSPTPTKKPIGTGEVTPNASLAAALKMTVTPGSLEVKSGQTGTATVDVDTPEAITGGGFKITFDKDSLQVDSITPGDKWELGTAPNYDTTISRANDSGELSLAVKQKSGASPVAAGKVTLFTITFKPKSGDGSSDLKLSQGYVLDKDGTNVEITALAGASIAESDGGGGGASIFLIVGALLGVGVLGGGGFLTWRRTRGNRWEE